MNLEKYEAKAENSYMLFEFFSEGPKGKIKKVVIYEETNLMEFYNLSFGDQDPVTGKIDDSIVTANNDGQKVLATVISTLYTFTDHYPYGWVYATGTDKRRTRLYRMGISRYLDNISKDFVIYGLKGNKWEKFKKGNDYVAFIAKRKLLNLKNGKR